MNPFDDTQPEETGGRLDAGLRAAFGPADDSGVEGWPESVVATLDQAMGIHSRVSLRDDSDGAGPLCRPRTDELEDSEGRIGRYQLAGEIARGGMGVVLRGRDVDLGRDVAIKMLRGRHAANPAMVRRFLEEAQIAGQLQHPGILPVYELGVRRADRPYFAMKLVKGRTLATLLRERRAPGDERRRFLTIFEHVCQTMAYAHARGVVHRDLKPSNIMVGAFGETQIVDWGLAKVLGRSSLSTTGEDETQAERAIETARSGDSGSQSIAGAMMGTPAYMPVEQAQGAVAQVDERSDVFALGAILCEILTGGPAYVGAGDEVIRRAKQGDVSDALSRLRASGEDPLLTVIAERCLARNPEDRPRDAGALTTDVSRYLADLEASAQAAKVAAAAAEAKAAEERRARRLTIALAASLFFVVALVGAGFYWRAESQRERVAEATGLAGAALERAASQLGQAKASRADDDAAWEAAVAAGEQLERLIAAGPVEENTRSRADALLADLRAADADRRLLALTDDIVQQGATHSDVDSWKQMDDAYVEAFRDAGIDVRTASDEAIAAWIRKSEHPERLANAFELWVWTGEDLRHRFGVDRYTRSLRERATPIFLADTDPFRTKLRDQMYRLAPESNTIDVNVLRELADDPAFETAPATSLSWLGTCFFSAREPDFVGGMRVYRRAVALYPDDFLLNSDYARMLAMLGKDAEASRILSRCVALRPDVSGAWRTLGITLRKLESCQEAIEAIRRAISLQPDHMPTYVDLWLTCVAMGNLTDATSALDKAKSLAGDAIETHVMLMRALPERSPMERTGQLERAIALLESARSELPDDADSRSLLDAWMTECRRAIEYREATLPEVPEWAMPETSDEASR